MMNFVFKTKHWKLCLGIFFVIGYWALVITSTSWGAKSPDVQPEASFGKLSVYSDVLGADIYVDAKFVGQDRAAISHIPEGKHYVRVVKGENTIQSGLVEVKEGEETIIVAKENQEALLSKIRKPNHVLIFGGMTAVGYNEVNPGGTYNLTYRAQYGVGTEVKFVVPVVDVNVDLGFSLNYPSAITAGTTEAQMAISSPYICVGKDLIKFGSTKISAGLGLNYGIFNPGGGTLISISSRLGYQGYLELFKPLADNQRLVVKAGYVSYAGKSSTSLGAGDVTCAGLYLQAGMAYQL